MHCISRAIECDLPVTSVQQLLACEPWCHGCHCCCCVFRWNGGIFSTWSGSDPGCIQIYGGERGIHAYVSDEKGLEEEEATAG